MEQRKEANGFKIPVQTEEAWRRLEQGGGSRSDLDIVLISLAKVWAFEPDAFDRWLGEHHHVERKDLPPSMLAEYRRGFEREQASKERRTRDLVEGLANGPYLLPLIEFSHAFSDELKGIVFKIALATTHNEDFVFVLSALSMERPLFVHQCTSGLPDSPILQIFFAYTKKTRQPLALEVRQPVRIAEDASPLDRLCDMATRPWKTLQNDLRNLSEPETSTLLHLAERLFQRLSENRAFEAFLKLNLSVFIVTVHPDSNLIPSAVRLLVSNGEPALADLLALLGENYLASELRDAKNSHPGRERFLAAIIDAYRRRFPESISNLKADLTKVSSTRQPVLEVAVAAALLRPRSDDEARFERLLLRKLQKDKEHHVREWILRNPEFARYFRAEKASLSTLKGILDEYRSKEPELALRIAAQILSEPLGPTRDRYWEEALRILVNIGRDEADALFSKFMTDRLADGWDNPQIQQVLASQPARTLLRRSFWLLLDTAGSEGNRQILFDLYTSHTPESELVALIEAAYVRGRSPALWIVEHLVPRLLERQSLSPTFPQYATNREFLVRTAQDLGRRTVEDTSFLREAANDWASTRTRAKSRLLPRLRTGVRIAIENSLSDSALRAQITRLSNDVEEWAENDSPKLDAAISSYASTALPIEHAPDRSYGEQFFRERPRGPNDFALFAGANPWVIDLVFADEQGPWPKSELLLSQLARSFVFISQLRRRVQAQIEAIDHTVRVELATVLRQPLADIEAELAGYFILRDILDEGGLHPVMEKLGGHIDEKELSSQRHKVIRDPSRRGLLRVFGLGIRVDDVVIGSGTVIKSGGDDDRD